MLILAAMVAALAVGSARQRTAGTAVALPVVAVPTSGTCLRHTGTSDAVEVPCEQAHTAEVLTARHAWSADDDAGYCRTVYATSYISSAVDWAPPPNVAEVTGRIRSGGGELGWIACARRPVAGLHDPGPLSYLGLLSDPGGPTATVGTCFGDDDQRIGCSLPHRSERLGVFRAADRTQQPITNCATFAAGIIGSADAFTGPTALTATAADLPSAEEQAGMLPWFETEREAAVAPVPQTCDARAPNGRTLTGSVIGLGADPVPFG